LDYGSVLYLTTLLKSLDSVYNTGIRLATGAFRTSPVESLYVDSNCLPPFQRREKQLLSYALRITTQYHHPLSKKLDDWNLIQKFYDRKENFQPLYVRCRKILSEKNFPNDIDKKSICSVPPWLVRNLRIDLSLTKFKKNIPSTIFSKNTF
jgi:hypothetical protein